MISAKSTWPWATCFLVFVVAARAETVGTQSNCELELTFWNDVKESSDKRELEAYIETFPDGAFVALALVRIDRLSQRTAEPEAAAAVVSPPVLAPGKQNPITNRETSEAEPPSRWAFNGDYSITDHQTGLRWLGKPPHLGPGVLAQSDPKDPKDWRQALIYCHGVMIERHGSWRLPTRAELTAVADFIQPQNATCIWTIEKVDEQSAWVFDVSKREAKQRPLKSFLPCGLACVLPPV